VTAADGTSKLVSFTIHGTNDAAVIGDPNVADVHRGQFADPLTADRSISITDVDTGENHFNTTVTPAPASRRPRPGRRRLLHLLRHQRRRAVPRRQQRNGAPPPMSTLHRDRGRRHSKLVSFTITAPTTPRDRRSERRRRHRGQFATTLTATRLDFDHWNVDTGENTSTRP